jgi:AraC-like DNA-binding protein
MTQRPPSLPRAPEFPGLARPPPDLLSDLLQTVKLSNSMFFVMGVGSPWPPTRVPPGRDLARSLAQPTTNLISYHVIAEGEAWVGLFGGAPVKLSAGDIVVFPKGDPYYMSQHAEEPPPPVLAEHLNYFNGHVRKLLPFHVNFGDARCARFICGFLGCDDLPFNPLLESLPSMMIVRRREHPELQRRLDALVTLTLDESSGRQGEDSVRMRLSELLFVEVVRLHLESLPPSETGWLAGLRDEVVGKAIAALHQEPARDWSLASLAKAVGSSRTVLAERFSKLVGQPPMQYLTRWRIQLAAQLLKTGRKVSAVALEVGYESEAAFSRAFKKITQVAPAQWRKATSVSRS